MSDDSARLKQKMCQFETDDPVRAIEYPRSSEMILFLFQTHR